MESAKLSRLNKYLVEHGLADSRRAADRLIKGGEIMVNGQRATLATVLSPGDEVRRGNQVASESRQDITIAYHKPAGLICSHSVQGGGAPTIFSQLPKSFARLKFAGRLDKDSEGLMILSSDGDVIQRLSHPSSGKSKEYVVQLGKPMPPATARKLLAGVELEDGISKFASLHQLSPTRLRVTLHEGRNRQIRRSFEALGNNVTKLVRTRIGSYTLGNLSVGKFEIINPSELL